MNYRFNFTPVIRSWDLLPEGVLLSVQLSAIAMVPGLIVGTIAAALKPWGPRAAGNVITACVEFIRNTPFLRHSFSSSSSACRASDRGGAAPLQKINQSTHGNPT